MPIENPFFKNEDEREELEKVIDSEIEKNEKVRDLLPYKYGFDQKAEDQELNINSEAFLLDKSLEVNKSESIETQKALLEKFPRAEDLRSAIEKISEYLEIKKGKPAYSYSPDEIIKIEMLEKECTELLKKIGENPKILKGNPILLDRKLDELFVTYRRVVGSSQN